MQQTSGCSLDAGERIARAAWLSRTAHPRAKISRVDPQFNPASVHRTAPERGMGDGYHLHRTWQGWLSLAVVLDLFSRRFGGWAVRPTIHRELVLGVVMKAVRSRCRRKTLIHSDQGSQDGGDAWQRFCKDNYLEPSMSRRANCWDNAAAEPFFNSSKKNRSRRASTQIVTWRPRTYPTTSMGFTIQNATTAIWAGSVLKSSRQRIATLDQVSTKDWEFQSAERQSHEILEVLSLVSADLMIAQTCWVVRSRRSSTWHSSGVPFAAAAISAIMSASCRNFFCLRSGESNRIDIARF